MANLAGIYRGEWLGILLQESCHQKLAGKEECNNFGPVHQMRQHLSRARLPQTRWQRFWASACGRAGPPPIYKWLRTAEQHEKQDRKGGYLNLPVALRGNYFFSSVLAPLAKAAKSVLGAGAGGLFLAGLGLALVEAPVLGFP